MTTLSSSPPYALALASCTSYERSLVEDALAQVLTQSGIVQGQAPFLSRGMHVLVKPNLLRPHELTCTHAEVVRAVCVCLLEQGLRVTVADSPGFGTAQAVAHKIGLTQALQPLGIAVEDFSDVRPVPLEHALHKKSLGTWHIARKALEADAIVSVPRCKAHVQMRMTLAVKNLFGCIAGLRKALAHTVQGRSLEDFCQSILSLYAALPPTAGVIDAVVAMHKHGPSGGEPYALHCIGASPSALALDTGIYTLLQQEPAHIPLWKCAQDNALAAAFMYNIHHTGVQPPHFYPSTTLGEFLLPQNLMHVSFQPHRLLLSYMKRLWSRVF